MFYSILIRSTHRSCYIKKGVFKNFAKFTGKHLCQIHFFNKFAGVRPATLLIKSLWHRCSPINFAKFLRKFFLRNTFARLLLFSIMVMLLPKTSTTKLFVTCTLELLFHNLLTFSSCANKTG